MYYGLHVNRNLFVKCYFKNQFLAGEKASCLVRAPCKPVNTEQNGSGYLEYDEMEAGFPDVFGGHLMSFRHWLNC